MDGMLTYTLNAERLSYSRTVPKGPLLFTLTGCCDDDQPIRFAGFAEYAKFVDWMAGFFFAALKQGNFARGLDDSKPRLDNAVDYAEQH